jgi:Na+/H+ antiporter NhaC
MNIRFSLIFALVFASLQLFAQQNDSLTQDSLNTTVDTTITEEPEPVVEEPKYDTLGLGDFSLTVSKNNENKWFLNIKTSNPEEFIGHISIAGKEEHLLFNDGTTQYPIEASFAGELVKLHSEKDKIKVTRLIHVSKRKNGDIRWVNIPLWWSIVPPLIAIFLALIFRQVLLALFVGILSGAWLVNGMQFTPYGLLKSFFKVLDTYILQSLTDTGHLSVIIFSLMIGGVVALISRNGGMAGIVKQLAPLAKGPKSTQFVAWLLGIAIFFDDYANTLIVGNTIRPITDKFKISREKLAYIVDSTAAPIAAIAFITTWIGAELGYIDDAMPLLDGLKEEDRPSAYSIFLSSLPYSFYSFFTLLFIPLLIFSGRDFGAMFKAEKRARTTGQVFAAADNDEEDVDLEELEPKKGAPLRWLNGLIPVLVVVFGTLMGLIDTGLASCYDALLEKGVEIPHNGWGMVWSKMDALGADGEAGFVRKLGIMVGNSDSYAALLWASISAVFVAILMSVGQGIMKMGEALDTTVKGFKTMMPALLILVLAWSLAHTTEELSTAEFLTSTLGSSINPYFLPVIIFILSALISFSTGSSWSTMAILYPIAIPMTWEICINNGMDMDMTWALLYNNIAIVLSASVLGDHCSPISDTTILSSLASNCKHIDHVSTQLPYALTVGAVSLVCAYTSTAFGIPFIVNFLLGMGILAAVVFLLGKKVDDDEGQPVEGT